MCNFSYLFAIDYVSYIGIPPIIFLFFLGFLILFSDFKNRINRTYFFIILFMIIWVTADFLSFYLRNPDYIVWGDRISSLGLVGAAFIVLFIYIFPENKAVSKKIISYLFAPLVPFFLLVPTSLYEKIGPAPDCINTTGPLYWIMAGLLLYYIIWSTVLIRKKFKNLEGVQKEQFKIFTVGIVLLLVLAIFFDIVPTIYDAQSIVLFVPYTTLIFAVSCAYAIVKHKALNVKIVAAQMLTVLIWILTSSEFFFIKNTIDFILVGITLILSIVFGIFLMISVKNEVKRKEELQKISDALAIANERLKELDLTKSEFISIASHQLRTPLTAIKGYISLVLEGSYGKVPAAIQDVLNKVYTVNSRLVHLVEDLLNVSRIEAGRIQYSFAPTQLEPLVAELVEMFSPTAKGKKLSLQMQLPEKPLPQLTIDPNKIKEVLSNLIDNSLKYTKEGGTTVTLEGGDSVARIIVSDTGIGIRPEDQKNLFEKFTRSKETTKMVASGAGLGLYVGKSFVEAHGGKIWAESDGQDKGSRFIIELPLINPKIHAGTSDQPSQKTT